MDQQRFRTGERINNISTNTFQIWETTVRLARIRTLMDHLCAANDENDELIYCLREPNEPIEDTPEDTSNDPDEEDGSINSIIKDIRSRPRTRGAVKMIFYNRLAMISDKLTQDIKFRSENAEFFDDLELVLSRMSDEAAEITKREIMKYLAEAKERLAKKDRERQQLLQQQQQQSFGSSASSSAGSSLAGSSNSGF
ncbi:uncharacterized protein LOC128743471 isoform X2 [Sabethes cyaneus]|uniref:uncharacterized protein LOC128743471 isoform X2 n=1 Tax=Sabethes cyaneus TaxID=53552 RepID=UPI00237DF9E8|nr:uncharacterized protein LOC128743471 isoform X2 [Sabethes cyaneus]